MVTSDEQERHLCVEIAIADRSWVERLPPAPGGADTRPITLSFDDVELAARDRTAVTALGYEIVGPAAASHVAEVAHLLVGPTAVQRHPRWWRALLDLATRVYDLRFGPVQQVLRDVLAVHLDRRADGGDATPLRARAPRPPSA